MIGAEAQLPFAPLLFTVNSAGEIVHAELAAPRAVDECARAFASP